MSDHAELAVAFAHTRANTPTRIDGSMSLTMTTDQLVASFDEPFAVPYIAHAYLCRRTSATPS